MNQGGSKVRITEKGPTIWCPACKERHVCNAPATPTRHGGDPRNLDDWEYRTVCHSFVTDGRIQFLADCAHAMKGTTVPLPDWPEGVDV